MDVTTIASLLEQYGVTGVIVAVAVYLVYKLLNDKLENNEGEITELKSDLKEFQTKYDEKVDSFVETVNACNETIRSIKDDINARLDTICDILDDVGKGDVEE